MGILIEVIWKTYKNISYLLWYASLSKKKFLLSFILFVFHSLNFLNSLLWFIFPIIYIVKVI